MVIKKRKLYLGPQIRRLRRERGQTQAQMAGELGVSPSYVNLIERGQRPVSADLLVRIASAYDLDLSDFSAERADDLFKTLNEALFDPLFQNAGATREDAHELAAGNPVLGEAVAALYRAYRTAQAELTDARAAGRTGEADPVEEARAFIQASRNYFPALDEAGEEIAGACSHPHTALFEALAGRFAEAHRLRVRVLPREVMSGAYRRLNRHAGEVLISESLDEASRRFQLALQLVLIEQASPLDRLVNETKFESDAGRRLARAALASYAAAAIMLPYKAFRAAAEELRYDVEALGRRFGASFEQVAHRLTTLQKPGAEGVSFFFLRVDAAGNISKRYSGDVFPFARYGGSCPLWNVHEAMKTPRRILTQMIALPGGEKFFSIARAVHGGAAFHGAP
ncbi:MAG TPA: short-chain fatty acyl-CoA regulator family protein, partial [Parvularculaceae bacterium]|nr:short-chain fatty acyl-CoA regulator family protein [Parvularculaceae bacterium]